MKYRIIELQHNCRPCGDKKKIRYAVQATPDGPYETLENAMEVARHQNQECGCYGVWVGVKCDKG